MEGLGSQPQLCVHKTAEGPEPFQQQQLKVQKQKKKSNQKHIYDFIF